MLPITSAVYAFRTDDRIDTFTVITAAGVANATVQLTRPIYDDDTSTIEFSSNDIDDAPIYSSYNATTRALIFGGLAANTTRSVDITYDVDALSSSNAISNLLDHVSWMWIVIWVIFPAAGLAAIWTGRLN